MSTSWRQRVRMVYTAVEYDIDRFHNVLKHLIISASRRSSPLLIILEVQGLGS